MKGLFVEGFGVVGPFGMGRESYNAFLNAEVSSLSDKYLRGILPAGIARKLNPNPQKMRRQDWYSLLALTATRMAIEDAGFPDVSGTSTALLLVSSRGPARTVTGFFKSLPEEGEIIGSPGLFVQSLPNSAAAKLCAEWGLEGSSFSISAPGGGLLRQIQSAEALLSSGDIDRVIMCVVEETLGPLSEDADSGRVHPSLEVYAEGATSFLFSNKICAGRAFYELVDSGKSKDILSANRGSCLQNGFVLGFYTQFVDRELDSKEGVTITFEGDNTNRLFIKKY